MKILGAEASDQSIPATIKRTATIRLGGGMVADADVHSYEERISAQFSVRARVGAFTDALITGIGDTEDDAIANAIREARKQHAALDAFLAYVDAPSVEEAVAAE